MTLEERTKCPYSQRKDAVGWTELLKCENCEGYGKYRAGKEIRKCCVYYTIMDAIRERE